MGVIIFGFVLFIPLLLVTWLAERKPRQMRKVRNAR